MTVEEINRTVERLLLAFDMFEFGVELMRQNLKRKHAGATDEEINLRLDCWLRERSCAPHGDCPGISRDIESLRK
jgi:hypothetical protein